MLGLPDGIAWHLTCYSKYHVSRAMTMIKANCREQLCSADIQFLASSVGSRPGAAVNLVELLTEPSARDAALESRQVLNAILEAPRPLQISARLYFYVLVRHSLVSFDRSVADYVASVLTAFVHSCRTRALPAHPGVNAVYVTDMLAALSMASAEEAFLIRVHVGNYSLFLSGIFPEHVRHRTATRAAPDLGYYEELGSTSYRLAAEHHLARRHALTDTYRTMADRFSEVRLGLNSLTDQLLCIEPTWSAPQ
jgi:hypothetical protein